MPRDPFFEEAVYELVCRIPPGRVTSYGAIAGAIGSRGGARLVGQVLTAANRNGRTDVPAHRVVNRQGLLTGKAHFPPPGMAERLRREGVAVADDRVLDFAGHFWDPRQALGEEAGA